MGKAKRGLTIFGGLFLIGGFILTAANEWNLARNQADIADLRGNLVDLSAHSPSPAAEGKPVYAAGTVTAAAPLQDPDFSVSANALKLVRQVEMLQWVERVEGSGDDRNYRYERVWLAQLVDSSRFYRKSGYENPVSFPVEAAITVTTTAKFGRLDLSPALLHALPAGNQVAPGQPVTVNGRTFAAHDGYWWSGDPGSPAVGDLRVRFVYAPTGVWSFIARLAANQLSPLPLNAAGVNFLAPGIVERDTLLGSSQQQLYLHNWGFRLLGLAGMFAGLMILRRTLPALVSAQRQNAVETALASPLNVVVLAAGFWCLALALAWIVYRPLLSLGLLIILGLALAWLLVSLRKAAT